MKPLVAKSPMQITHPERFAKGRPEPLSDSERRALHALPSNRGDDATMRPDVHAMEIRNDAEMDDAFAEWLIHLNAGRIG